MLYINYVQKSLENNFLNCEFMEKSIFCDEKPLKRASLSLFLSSALVKTLICFNQSKYLSIQVQENNFLLTFFHFMLLSRCPSKKAKSLVFVDGNMLCISDYISKLMTEDTILILTDVV